MKRRVGLDRELVERQMLAGFGDRALEFGGPRLRRLSLSRIDQVERIALESAARDGDGGERLFGGVRAAERLQCIVVEGLDAERHAIDAGGAIALKACRLDAGRVR